MFQKSGLKDKVEDNKNLKLKKYLPCDSRPAPWPNPLSYDCRKQKYTSIIKAHFHELTNTELHYSSFICLNVMPMAYLSVTRFHKIH